MGCYKVSLLEVAFSWALRLVIQNLRICDVLCWVHMSGRVCLDFDTFFDVGWMINSVFKRKKELMIIVCCSVWNNDLFISKYYIAFLIFFNNNCKKRVTKTFYSLSPSVSGLLPPPTYDPYCLCESWLSSYKNKSQTIRCSLISLMATPQKANNKKLILYVPLIAWCIHVWVSECVCLTFYVGEG